MTFKRSSIVVQTMMPVLEEIRVSLELDLLMDAWVWISVELELDFDIWLSFLVLEAPIIFATLVVVFGEPLKEV